MSKRSGFDSFFISSSTIDNYSDDLSITSTIFKERLKYLQKIYPPEIKKIKQEFSKDSIPSSKYEEKVHFSPSDSIKQTNYTYLSSHLYTSSSFTNTNTPIIENNISNEGEGDLDESTDRFELFCFLKSCKNEYDKKELLTCIKCKKSFHASCCDPPLRYKLVTRYPWSCTDCKACSICKSNKNEDTMLICDSCDRAYHMECMNPQVKEVPEGEWFCLECGQCHCCERIFTHDEALEENGFSYGIYRICSTCNFKYINKSTHLRKGKNKMHTKVEEDIDNLLCSVCIKPFSASDNMNAYSRCSICSQLCHQKCVISKKFSCVCNVCNEFQKSFNIKLSL